MDEKEGYERLLFMEEATGDTDNQIPVIFIANRAFGGIQEIETSLEETIKDILEARKNGSNISVMPTAPPKPPTKPDPEPEQPNEDPDPLKELTETVMKIKQQLDNKTTEEQRKAKRTAIAEKAKELGYEHPEDAHRFTGLQMEIEDIETVLKAELEARPYLKAQAPKTRSTNPGGTRNGETLEQKRVRLGLR